MVLLQLEDLRYYARALGYEIIYRDLHSRHPQLEGYVSLRFKKIFIDISIKNTRQEKCVLAEELGHILNPPAEDRALYHFAEYKNAFKTSWDRNNFEVLTEKDERRALLLATALLIPDQAFWDYTAQRKHEWWEWYEHFEVEEWFMRIKFEFMRLKHPFKWRDLVIKTAAERRHRSLVGVSTNFNIL